jgi:small subunit ribosomal protein S16
MLVIRLFRTGKKKQPSYKVVVTDRNNPPQGGKFVEQVGFYNPLTKEKIFHAERIQYWISVGAKPSDTVYNILINEGIVKGEKQKIVYKKSKKAVPEPVVAPFIAPKVEAAPVAAEPVTVVEETPVVAEATPTVEEAPKAE